MSQSASPHILKVLSFWGIHSETLLEYVDKHTKNIVTFIKVMVWNSNQITHRSNVTVNELLDNTELTINVLILTNRTPELFGQTLAGGQLILIKLLAILLCIAGGYNMLS